MSRQPTSSGLAPRLLLLAALSLAACGVPEGTDTSSAESTGCPENPGEESAVTVDEAETAESVSSMTAACLSLGKCTNDRKKCCSKMVTRSKSCSTTFSCCAPAGTWVHSKSLCCSGVAGLPDGHHNVKCY